MGVFTACGIAINSVVQTEAPKFVSWLFLDLGSYRGERGGSFGGVRLVGDTCSASVAASRRSFPSRTRVKILGAAAFCAAPAISFLGILPPERLK